MRKITFVCAMVMLVAFALPAQAAVQNVKVSGDVTLRGLYRDELDLDKDDTSLNFENESFLMSTVGVNIEADLTDNVSAAIRLVSQRDWDRDGAATTDVDLDLAYITLKEMLYSPLTLVIGRQDIWMGDGFIVGANRQQFPGITAQEFTDITSFDAIRAILDYDPWTIDLLWAKIDENSTTVSDDIDLYGVNVGYLFGEYDAEMEGYYFCKFDGSLDPSRDTHTIGARGSFKPLENLDLRGEMAFQFGDYTTARDIEAWALDLSGEYYWADYAWMPTLGLGYVYLSGEESANAGDYEAFDRLYYGKTYSAIREWQDIYYATAEGGTNIPPSTSVNSTGAQNAHTLIVNGSIQPTDNILLEGKYLYFLLDEDDAQGEDEVGSEVDLTLTYEYTEDVTFGLLAAWFFSGDVFAGGTDDDASLVVGTVSLVF